MTKPLLIAIAMLIGQTGSAVAASPAMVQTEPMFFAYPANAFDKGEQGRVGVELAITETGAVAGCTVVQPVSASLDEASCSYWKRTRFRAAYDERGQPVASTLRKFSDWHLPR